MSPPRKSRRKVDPSERLDRLFTIPVNEDLLDRIETIRRGQRSASEAIRQLIIKESNRIRARIAS